MRALFAAVVLISIASAGCEHRYEALTAPPPGMVASLDDGEKHIRLSTGVALAFECFRGSGNDPCDGAVSTSRPDIVLAYPANLDSLTERDYRKGPSARSVYVVVGIADGETSVSAGGGSLSVAVSTSGP